MLAAILAMTLTCPTPDAWLDGERLGPDARTLALAEAQRTCRALGASHEVCSALDEVGRRESRGDQCAVHVQGKGEYGFGLHGLSVKWQARRWDRSDPDALRDPRISTVVVLRLWRNTVSQGPRTWLDIQRVYGGRFKRVGARELDKRDRSWCKRLKRRGVDCRAKVSANDFGQGLGLARYPGQDDDLRAALEAEA